MSKHGKLKMKMLWEGLTASCQGTGYIAHMTITSLVSCWWVNEPEIILISDSLKPSQCKHLEHWEVQEGRRIPSSAGIPGQGTQSGTGEKMPC